MIARLVTTGLMFLPLSLLANDSGTGEDIFERRCASCHSLTRVRAMLDDVKPADRPAHLVKFLGSHPSKLDDGDQELVIEVLSRP